MVFELLENFDYIEQKSYSILLNRIAEYIIDDSGFQDTKTQILSLTFEDDADSSQKVLDQIKVPLAKKGWSNFKTVNRLGYSRKNVDKGYSEIIIVDEFIGTGRTLKGRIDYLRKNIEKPFNLKCCFIAGMETAIQNVITECDVEIYCPFPLKKGISEAFTGDDIEKRKNDMERLEKLLCEKINKKSLTDYSFGYGLAEALYSSEGCDGNTPNSVFPIFWWPKDNKNVKRETILFRYEPGLSVE